MNLILYSCSIQNLDIKQATTSSENFELNLIYNISKYFKNIYIISKRAHEVDYNIEKNVKLIPIKNTRFLKKDMEDIQNNENLFLLNATIILFFGYDYITLKNLKYIARKYRSKLISFVFDTHKGAIENKNIIKKILLDIYFKLGILTLNSLDGILLFKEQASKELNLKIPYLVSKIGINENEISERIYIRRNKKYKIVYTGSLEKYNGINIMIDCMKYIKDDDISLEIYGEGNLRNYVEDNSTI